MGVKERLAESELAPGAPVLVDTTPTPPEMEQVIAPKLGALTVTVKVTLCPTVMVVADAEMLTPAACTVKGRILHAIQSISKYAAMRKKDRFINRLPQVCT